MSDRRVFVAESDDAGKRIDSFLAGVTEDELSRSRIQKLIDDGLVQIGGRRCKASAHLAESDEVTIDIPDAEPVELLPEDIPLDILYEDEDILIVNKPKGMVVHPAPGHMSGTLVNAVMFHCGDSLSGINGLLRPGIVHRIDRDTTGSLIICKNDRAHRSVAGQLAEHSVKRIYLGIVVGRMSDDMGTVNAPIGRDKRDRKRMCVCDSGRNAVTHYRVLERYSDASLCEFRLETGRTHQIRVHMAHIGHPILGDAVYGPSKCRFKLEGQTLHAMTIGLVHPTTGEWLETDAPLPEYFTRLLTLLR